MSARKHRRHKPKKPGTPPGTLEYTGEKRVDEPLVFEVRYNGSDLGQRSLPRSEAPAAPPGSVTWYDVRGLHDVALVEQFGKHFDIHPLALEDILNTQQRPKFEEYGDDIFIIAEALTFDKATLTLNLEQIAFFFGQNFLLTFQEIPDDTFAAVREHLFAARGRIRTKGSDYLAYALLDNIVDNYFGVLDQIETQIELLEEEISGKPTRTTKEKIHHLKFQMLHLRKAVMPLREAVARFARCENACLEDGTALFVRDLHDHVIRIVDISDSYRDMLFSLTELYQSELSLRMNSVMQVLTVITTIFVPLTFLAGVYGMNFKHMPELEWRYGYHVSWGVFAVVAVALLVWFKRKKWI